ncbi:LacI family DNA-binding transcriptional regulator [Cupriavidus sp. UME77]|uniref:LacI family DNA-binding transcriptional regulator n=1 Tax=Cupriavidus sp. UME77 TaxID=1862321 RepID=UPI00160471ED|nr:substrate-binding domain-containing protein [Cupriavidus sp. UME77]MBB1632412.1 LacI family transcriptional regulator [Cupriavidus sp. UME77]
MATIQDVARLANVSVSSVSNVLNGRTERLNPATFERVREAIRTLGFRPSQVARQLKTGQTPMLGLLVPSTANPMYGQFALKIEAEAQRQTGYRVLLGNTNRDREQESRMLDDLLSFGVHGVIIVSSLTGEQHFEVATRQGLAMVSYDGGADPNMPACIDHVAPDNYQAGHLAASHLLELGHRRIAFVMPAGRTVSRASKIAGFQAAVKEAGLGDAVVIECPPTAHYGDAELAELGQVLAGQLAQVSTRPTGLVAVNDMMAIGLMSGLHQAGLSVPADVSVIGMDDISMCSYTNPALTSVAMPFGEMAQAMVRRVMLRLAQPDEAPVRLCFPSGLVVRHSTAKPPAANRLAGALAPRRG